MRWKSAPGSASPRLSWRAAFRPATRSGSMCRRRSTSRCRPIPKVPIIMIGPGTGLAPFRAFLQERQATKAPGRNWLFFGHQRSNYDFFYEDELVAMRSAGLLTRLTLAWSRDAGEKIYVQHRMREVGRDLWSWLADGAHVYVCGDATAHGQGCRTRVGRRDRRTRRANARRGGRFPRRDEEARPLSSRCLLAHRKGSKPWT